MSGAPALLELAAGLSTAQVPLVVVVPAGVALAAMSALGALWWRRRQ